MNQREENVADMKEREECVSATGERRGVGFTGGLNGLRRDLTETGTQAIPIK